MTETAVARLHAIVEGRVQGVGFRYFVYDWAIDLGLTGWVRNRWDGNVELVAEAPQAALDRLVVALRRGPSSAFVSDLKMEWGEATGEFPDFRIRHTE